MPESILTFMRIISIVLFFVIAGSANGSDVLVEVEKVKTEADVVVVVTILSAKLHSSSFTGQLYQYKIQVESVERGELKEKELLVTYENLVTHQRGDMRVWPLKRGSGIESNLKVGESYCLYLGGTGHLEIFLAEIVKRS